MSPCFTDDPVYLQKDPTGPSQGVATVVAVRLFSELSAV